MAVQMLASVIPVTAEVLEDAPYVEDAMAEGFSVQLYGTRTPRIRYHRIWNSGYWAGLNDQRSGNTTGWRGRYRRPWLDGYAAARDDLTSGRLALAAGGTRPVYVCGPNGRLS